MMRTRPSAEPYFVWALHTTLNSQHPSIQETIGVRAISARPLCAAHAPVFASSYGTFGKTVSIAPGGSGCGCGEPSGRKMS